MEGGAAYNETELLTQLLSGSEQAFEIIYQQYSSRLYGNILKMVKLETEAQEILQDTFLIVWNNREMIDPERSFRSYLFKIVENKVYDFFRKANRDKQRAAYLAATASSEYVHIEEAILSKENSSMLEKAIESLPPQRRQVFRLCKLEDKSYKEVAELLGISVSTISDHIVKATKAIRLYIENNDQALMVVLVTAFLAGI